MLGHFKDFLLDRSSAVESPMEKARAFLFDELDSYYRSPRYINSVVQIVTTPYRYDDGHPLGLGNSRIVKTILEHLPIHDVIEIRRVNSVWNNTACEILRESLSHCKLRPSKLKLFLKRMKKSPCNPFSAYAIRIERLDDSLTKKFLHRFPPYIVRLRVKIASSQIPDFTQILIKMRLLKELHLIRIPEDSHTLRVREYVPRSNNVAAWKYGLYTLPNLETMILESDDPSAPFVVNYDICIVNLINSAANLIQLKFINWESPLAHIYARRGLLNPKSFNGSIQTSPELSHFLQSDIEELFFRHELKFKALKFTIDPEIITFNFVLEGIIKSKTFTTLYHLSLKNGDPSEVFRTHVTFPVLVNLGLSGWEGPVNFWSVQKQFPSLQTLKLNKNSLIATRMQRNESLSSLCSSSTSSLVTDGHLPTIQGVTTLVLIPQSNSSEVDQPIQNDDVIMISKAAKLFPNVKELHILVETNETLLEVYKQMPQLELLRIDFKDNGEVIGDEAFTGTPESSVKIEGWHECKCPQFSIPDDFVPSNDGIRALKNLETLIVRAGPSITNMSLVDGIVFLEKLEHLMLLQSPYNNEGDETIWCLGAIADNLKNLKRLVISETVSYSEKDLDYLKTKLPKVILQTRITEKADERQFRILHSPDFGN